MSRWPSTPLAPTLTFGHIVNRTLLAPTKSALFVIEAANFWESTVLNGNAALGGGQLPMAATGDLHRSNLSLVANWSGSGDDGAGGGGGGGGVGGGEGGGGSSNSSNSWFTFGRIQIPLYGIILLLALVGNFLVIMTLVQHRRMRTITNVFLLNLAVSDILLGVLCMPFTLVGALKRDFVFGEVMCKVLPFMQACSVSVSAWTLVAISCERYYAICHPLRSRRWQTLRHAYKLIALIWAGSLVCMLPIAFLSQLIPTSNGHHKCRELWPPNTVYERVFNICLVFALLALPLIVLFTTYSLISRTLWRGIVAEQMATTTATSSTGSAAATANGKRGPPDKGRNGDAKAASTSSSSSSSRTKRIGLYFGGSKSKQGPKTTPSSVGGLRCNGVIAGRPLSTCPMAPAAQGQCTPGHLLLTAGSKQQRQQPARLQQQLLQQRQQYYLQQQLEHSNRYVTPYNNGKNFGMLLQQEQQQKLQQQQQQQKRSVLGNATASGFRSAGGGGNGGRNGGRSATTPSIVWHPLHPAIGCGHSNSGLAGDCGRECGCELSQRRRMMQGSGVLGAVAVTGDVDECAHCAGLADGEGGDGCGGGGGRSAADLESMQKDMTKITFGLRRTNTEKSLENKQRVIRMLFVVVLEFFLCWTPLYTINTLVLFDADYVYRNVGYQTISLLQLLAYSSSCCNPITYCFMNRGFRKACLNLFRPCRQRLRSVAQSREAGRRFSLVGVGVTQSSEVT